MEHKDYLRIDDKVRRILVRGISTIFNQQILEDYTSLERSLEDDWEMLFTGVKYWNYNYSIH